MTRAATLAALAGAIDIFAWQRTGQDGTLGEIDIDYKQFPDGPRLRLLVWTPDNENGDDEPRALSVWAPIVDSDPREQIRNLIHIYLCHEADEQLWFGNDRPYDPHREDQR